MHDAPAACENCATSLQGRFCHVCGQCAHNPLRHVGHAIEEFFEAFWHLDGRVFRTLRELFIPGRVACNYLAGQRVRYIAPLRLFVVLTLLAFFVGKSVFSVTAGMERPQAKGSEAIAAARTAQEVQTVLDREIGELEVARQNINLLPAVGGAFDQQEASLRTQAAQRIEALGGPKARVVTAEEVTRSRKNTGFASHLTRQYRQRLRDPRSLWHPQRNPLDLPFLPGSLQPWGNRKLADLEYNSTRISTDGTVLLKGFLGSLPTALFVLMPVFALLLKLLYLRSHRAYLEHLVVALYSHAFLMTYLLLTFAGGMVLEITDRLWLTLPVQLALTCLGLYVPAYLLWMQKRVYGQGWPKTVLKYLLTATVYVPLVTLAALWAVAASLFAGH